jgi:hypothetical protein
MEGMGLGATLVFPVLGAGPERYVAFVAGDQAVVYLWNLVAYWVAAIARVLMVLALHERLKAAAPISFDDLTIEQFQGHAPRRFAGGEVGQPLAKWAVRA